MEQYTWEKSPNGNQLDIRVTAQPTNNQITIHPLSGGGNPQTFDNITNASDYFSQLCEQGLSEQTS